MNDKEFIIRKIRTQYTEKETTSLDTLKALDAEARRPAIIISYIIGIVSALVMGAGMSLVMTDIGTAIGIESAMTPGVILGIIGLAAALINYPLFKRMLASRKRQYADRIISLSNQIMKEEA